MSDRDNSAAMWRSRPESKSDISGPMMFQGQKWRLFGTKKSEETYEITAKRIADETWLRGRLRTPKNGKDYAGTLNDDEGSPVINLTGGARKSQQGDWMIALNCTAAEGVGLTEDSGEQPPF